MTPPSLPEQYAFLFRFLRECSEAYANQIAKPASDDGYDDWNPRTARFEVDAYFAFLLSSSLLGHKHNRQVWEDMCYLCEAKLTEIHREQVSSNDLSEVIVARIEDYGSIANRCAESGDAPTRAFIRKLRQHLMASSHADRVDPKHPIMIGDALQEFALFLEYLRVDLCFAGAFECGLKHVLQRTNDVRTLSEEELTSLVRAGQKEAAAIVARTLESMARESAPKPKP